MLQKTIFFFFFSTFFKFDFYSFKNLIVHEYIYIFTSLYCYNLEFKKIFFF